MNKKQNILKAALVLFTENGARATSTKSIATEAGVSEALIFKHFGTKDNLLEEIIKKGYQEASKFTNNYLIVDSPEEFLRKFIDLPQELVDNQFDFWRMQYKILPLNPIAQQYHNNFMNPSNEQLKLSFETLNYKHPELEAEIMLLFIDNVWKSYVSERLTQKKCQEIALLLNTPYYNKNAICSGLHFFCVLDVVYLSFVKKIKNVYKRKSKKRNALNATI